MTNLAVQPIAPFARGDIGEATAALADAIGQGAKQEGTRRKLYELQAAVASELAPVDCPLQHSFIERV